VNGYYLAYLHRPAEPAGLNGWVSVLAPGPLHGGLTDEQVIAALVASDEYFSKL
jgi:hypothetical protein